MEVGVRDFRAGLSQRLDRVRAGEEPIIDHSAPAAQLTPIERRRPFDRLVAGSPVTPVPS